MRQIQNQTQTYNDLIFNYQAALKSMTKEKKSKEKDAKEYKKKYKTLERQLESAENDYEIARDNYNDNENINKKKEHIIHRTHSLERMNITQKYEGDINRLSKREVDLDNKIHDKRIQIERQRGVIERNKAAGILKKKRRRIKGFDGRI